MKIKGNMTIEGREVNGKADIEFDVEMSAESPHKIEGYMTVNGIKMTLDATNTPFMFGHVTIGGIRIPVGLSQLLNPA